LKLRQLLNRFLPEGGVWRGSSILTLGTLVSQIIVLAASPILTRLYTPEDFGLLAVFMGILGILGGVASLRYQNAIPLPKSDREALPLLPLGFGIVACVSAVCLAVGLAFGDRLAAALSFPLLELLLWLLTLSIALVGVYEMLFLWALRRHAYAALAKTNITRSTALLAVQICAAPLGPIALVLGQAASQLMGVLGLTWRVLRPQWVEARSVSMAEIRSAAVRYRRFPLFDTAYGLLAMFAVQMPALFLASLFGPAAAGFYALTQRVLAAPIALVADAVTNAFFAAAPEANRKRELAKETTAIHNTMAQLAAPAIVAIILSAPVLFSLVFGSQWVISGQFAQWMALALYMQFVTSPLTSLFYVFERQKTSIAFQIINVAMRAGALVAGFWQGDLNLAVALFALASALSYALVLGWVVYVTGARADAFLLGTSAAFAWALALNAPLLVAVALSASPFWIVTASALTAALMGLRLLALAKEQKWRARTLSMQPMPADKPFAGLGGALLVLDMSYNLEEIRERQLLHSVTCRDLDGFFAHVWTVHPAATLLTSDAWGPRYGPPKHFFLTPRHTFVEGKAGRFAALSRIASLNFLLSQIGLLFHLQALIKREKVTVIRAGSPLYSGLFAWALSRLTGIPFALRVAENYDRSYAYTGRPVQPRIFRTRMIEKWVERFVFSRADLVAGINKDNLNFALVNGAQPGRSTIFRLGNLVDRRHFTDPATRPSPQPLLAEFNVAEELFLMIIGRLVDLKRPRDVIEVLGVLRARGVEVKCLFVGDGPLKGELELRAMELGVGRLAIFCGNQNQDWLYRVMPASACVLSPCTGRALSEAALAAAPVVAYDTEWQSEIVETDVTGELVPYADVSEMAAAVERILDSQFRARRLGAALRARALDMMDPDRLDRFERGAYLAVMGQELSDATLTKESVRPG
jgi:O-antigen/teichoic acid export membrane protein/glycosyltransferase involved in cell wall biosynthesis